MNTSHSDNAGAFYPASSAPVYVDSLSEDSFWNAFATAPTAIPLDASLYHGSTTSKKVDETIVVIPSSSVLLESSYAAATVSVANDHRAPPSTSTPYPSSSQHAVTSGRSRSSATFGPTEAIATPYNPRQRYFKGRLVKPKNAHLPDAVLEFKERRKRRTVIATLTGGVVGMIFLGPLGGVLGATGAYAAAKTVGKRRERRLTRKVQLQAQY
jgi:hypothetical protein